MTDTRKQDDARSWKERISDLYSSLSTAMPSWEDKDLLGPKKLPTRHRGYTPSKTKARNKRRMQKRSRRINRKK